MHDQKENKMKNKIYELKRKQTKIYIDEEYTHRNFE